MSQNSLFRPAWMSSLAAVLLVSACSEPGSAPRITGAPEASSPNVTEAVAPSSLGWQEQARTLIAANNMSPLAAARVLAALSVAQYSAVNTIGGPDAAGRLPQEGVGVGGRSGLEARRGAVAGASAEVLSFFFAGATNSLEQRVQQEGEVTPGEVHPDFAHGLVIGRSAGEAMVERVKTDRFTTPWTGTVPVGPGKWIANGPPAGATFGGVRPYFLTSGNQFRPPAPPAFASAAFLADLAEIRTLSDTRTPEQRALAISWNFPNGTPTPVGFWNGLAAGYIAEHAMDERAATHAFALMQAAMMDALIGCWEAKYHYWVLRPSQADPAITLTFAQLPNHPSYPSGHSCVSAAAATVIGHLFPEHAAATSAMVEEAGLSRMYGGIHFRFDITAGANLGVAVANWAIARDQQVGLLSAMQ